MKKWIWILYIFSGPFLFGQAPGYAGKYQVFQIDTYLFPSLGRYVLQEKPLQLNLRAGISTERVLSRNLSTQIGGSYFYTYETYNFAGREGRFRIQGITANLGIRSYTFHREGNIAPIGIFFQPGLHYVHYWLEDLDRNFYADQRQSLGIYKGVGTSFHLGTQRVIGNYISYQYGLQAMWIFSLSEAPSAADEAYIRREALDRVRGFFGFSFYVGVGVLLF